MIYFLLGITNGVVFTPPSEIVIWSALSINGIGFEFHQFILGNAIGHIFLFHIFKKYSSSLENFFFVKVRFEWVKSFELTYTNCISWLHEPSGSYLVYGRLLPFFHTFTSIVAAKNKVSYCKYVSLTIAGDYLFGIIIFFHYSILSKLLDQASYLVVLLLTFALVHWFVKRRVNSR